MSDLVARLREKLGDGAVLTGDEVSAEKARGWSRLGKPLAVVRPSSTEQVSTVMNLCHAAGQPVVPWGGWTGLVDGARPTARWRSPLSG